MTFNLSARCAFCQYPIDSTDDTDPPEKYHSTTEVASFHKKDSTPWVCTYCEPELPRLDCVCATCGQDLPTNAALEKCGACLTMAPAIDQLIAAFDYDFPINQWLPQLKFNRHTALAHWFGKMLAQVAHAQLVSPPDIIIPVPLHPKRLRSRGYNQAELIARALLKHLPQSSSIMLDTHSCRRAIYTQAQSGLSLKQRQHNIKAAFESAQLQELHVAIVDDVYTSGSTVNALAKSLKHAGASRVTALVAAHAALK
ncbi:MAG: ComF family protein [Gammaproteobacteria bacterium]|nr:ComF family protein [Gammaproteobacteria bacterium]